MTCTRSATRTTWVALLVVVLLGLVCVRTASAAGTGGIEVTPVPAVEDGRPVTTFRVEVPRDGVTEVPYLLSNVEDEPRTARVYAAQVTSVDGNFSLDEPGSSPYVSMEDREVTLQPDEVREETFEVFPGPNGPPDGEAYAAVVVEVRSGAVVQRANTLIYLTPAPRVPLPLLVLAAAVALVALAGAGVAVAARRRRAADDR